MKLNLPLVNAHTHAAMVAFRGQAEDMPLDTWLNRYIWPWEKQKIKPGFIYRYTKAAIKEMKRNGIRAFNDMYFFEDEVAKAAEEEKVYAVVGEVILGFPTASAETPGQALEYTEKLIKKYQASRYVQVAVAPHSIYALSKANLIKAKKLARKYRVQFHIHLAETKAEFDDCRKKHRATPVGYLNRLGLLDEKTVMAHCVWLTDRDIGLIANSGAKVIHCPLSNLKLGDGIAPVTKMLRAGIKVALGTDGAASSNRLDIWEAGKMAALLQKGISHDPTVVSARQAVEMMSLNGLRALGIKKIDGQSLSQIRTKFKKFKNFNFLYEKNISDLVIK
jgi:5-methylthioadenosine/S-adenosylhomocysteine deaminase